MVATIIITALIVIACLAIIRKMVINVKNGKSIDGCNGDCSHCSSCGTHR